MESARRVLFDALSAEVERRRRQRGVAIRVGAALSGILGVLIGVAAGSFAAFSISLVFLVILSVGIVATIAGLLRRARAVGDEIARDPRFLVGIRRQELRKDLTETDTGVVAALTESLAAHAIEAAGRQRLQLCLSDGVMVLVTPPEVAAVLLEAFPAEPQR